MVFLKCFFGWGFGAILLITSSRLCLLVGQSNMKWLRIETIYHTFLRLNTYLYICMPTFTYLSLISALYVVICLPSFWSSSGCIFCRMLPGLCSHFLYTSLCFIEVLGPSVLLYFLPGHFPIRTVDIFKSRFS